MRKTARPMDTVRTLVPIVISSTEGKQKKNKKREQSTLLSEANPQRSMFPFENPPDFLPTMGRPRGHLPEIRSCSTRDVQRSGSTGRKSKKKSKSSASAKEYSASNRAVSHGKVTGLSRETVRWEGALEDPLAEEERIELYRADRRQRYLAHRQAVLEETQNALGQPVPNGSKDVASP